MTISPGAYYGHAAPTWDTVTAQRIIDATNSHIGNAGLHGGGADLAGKVVGRNRRTTTSGLIPFTSNNNQGNATKIIEASASMTSGRVYQVYSPGFGLYGRSATIVRAQITYTTNGAVPGTTSTTLDMSQVELLPGDNVIACNIGKLYPATGNITFRCLLSAYLINAGSGADAAAYGASDWPIDLVILDVGTDPGASGTIW